MATLVDDAGYDAVIERPWTVPQGSDTVNPFIHGNEDETGTFVGTDLTQGWRAQGQMRARAGEDVWVTFDSEALDGPRISLTSDGFIYVILPHEETEKEEWNDRSFGRYDVELIDPNGYKTRIARGKVTVSKDITRI